MSTVINFFGGPGAGKTTTALSLAAHLKTLRKDVTYVPEFAYELVLEGNLKALDDQSYLFGEQAHRLYRAKQDFEYIVTDAPLFMGCHYLRDSNEKFKELEGERRYKNYLESLIMETFNLYENKTYFVKRGNRQFLQAGRVHDEEQSRAIDASLLEFADRKHIDYVPVEGVVDVIFDLREKGYLV